MTAPLHTGPDGTTAFSIRGRIIAGAACAALLVGGVGGWAATASLSGAVIVQGTVAVDQNLKVIQHRDGGIVGDILVRSGDHVDAGQVMFRLEDAQTRAELSIVRGQIGELRARKARLEAEREGLAAPVFPDDLLADPALSEIIAGERRIFRGSASARLSRVRQLELGIAQIEDEIAGLDAQLRSKEREIALVTEEHGKLDQLSGKRLITGNRIYAMERDAARLGGERGEVVAAIARARSRIGELRLQILTIEETARTDAQRELAQVETALSEREDRRTAIEDTLSRTEIRAPVEGYVNELHVHSVGGVITSAQVLATVVPKDARLKVETKVPPVSIEQVAAGQTARLRFTAFNQRTTPEVQGEVTFVSPAAARDAEIGGYAYTADIRLAAAEVEELGGADLRPGMPVEVYIQTEERTALSYLLKPVTDQFAKAMRER